MNSEKCVQYCLIVTCQKCQYCFISTLPKSVWCGSNSLKVSVQYYLIRIVLFCVNSLKVSELFYMNSKIIQLLFFKSCILVNLLLQPLGRRLCLKTFFYFKHPFLFFNVIGNTWQFHLLNWQEVDPMCTISISYIYNELLA